ITTWLGEASGLIQARGNGRLDLRGTIQDLGDTAAGHVKRSRSEVAALLRHKRRTDNATQGDTNKVDVGDINAATNGCSRQVVGRVIVRQRAIQRVQVNHRLAQRVARVGQIGQVDEVVTARAVEVCRSSTNCNTGRGLALNR